MVIVSCILDVVSHTIKEILVRTQPLNQEKFNFKISFFQLCISVVALPLIKLTENENKDGIFSEDKYKETGLLGFAFDNLKFGIQCICSTKSKDSIEQPSDEFTILNDGIC